MNAPSDITLASPDGRIQFQLFTDSIGRVFYRVDVDGTALINRSQLGITLEEANLAEDLALNLTSEQSVDEMWEPVWGPASEIRNRYNDATIDLGNRGFMLLVRVYDDGIAFRYVIPALAKKKASVLDDLTEFRFTGSAEVWWTPADYDSYEFLYEKTTLADAEAANTPVTLKNESGIYASIHEAALLDFADMTLDALGDGYRAALVPRKGEEPTKALIDLPFKTPWRTVTIARSAGQLIESNLILNLNEPYAIEDTSWIKPGTYIGIWWAIHKGQATWRPGEHVAATTENAKEYIDFAAKNGIPYVLVEGWNVGWTGDWKEMDFTTAQDQFDLFEAVQYAKDRGVDLIAHMETGANPEGLEEQLDDAFGMYQKLGIRAVKTGYVGEIDDHYHHDQWMVQHHQHVVEKAAEYGIMVDAHEPVKSTGLERTWPNAITREAVRGMEYNAWSEGNPSSHTVTLPFTRMLAGPLDYTPGIFRVDWDPIKLQESEVVQQNEYEGPTRVHTTRARQMALPVIFLSGLQMLADLPEHYEGEPEFDFFRRLPATWDETRVLSGEIGKHLIMARRSAEEWFVAAINDENFQVLDIPLDFLGDGMYRADIYADADGTDYKRRPNDVMISRKTITTGDLLNVELGGGGGWVARIRR